MNNMQSAGDLHFLLCLKLTKKSLIDEFCESEVIRELHSISVEHGSTTNSSLKDVFNQALEDFKNIEMFVLADIKSELKRINVVTIKLGNQDVVVFNHEEGIKVSVWKEGSESFTKYHDTIDVAIGYHRLCCGRIINIPRPKGAEH